MPNEEKKYLVISRRKILEAFIRRVMLQPNVQKVCSKRYPEYMIIPADRIDDWQYDMGVILGKAIHDAVDQ